MDEQRDFDAVTLEVVRSSLDSIADEINAALVHAAYSTNIKDRADCSCVLYDAAGNVVAMSEYGGTPLHLGTMIWALKTIFEIYPEDSFGPGDAVISNSPYPAGPGHLNDVCVAGPIFVDGRLVGFAASEAHRVDVGGTAPGSMPFGVTQIHQEGLQITPVKIVRSGLVDEPLLAMLNANVRTPVENTGDFYAQLAGLNVARKRFSELVAKYGHDAIQEYMKQVMDYGERRMMAAIRAVPDGRYEAEDIIEGDGISADDVHVRCSIEVAGDRLTADFSGTGPQVAGSLNTKPPSVAACVFFVIKSMLDPGIPANAGAYRRLEIVTRPGTLLDANYPAPTSQSNIITIQRICDVIIAALADALPERSIASCQGAMTLLNIGGYVARTGQFFNYIETYAGGQGAKLTQDGLDVVQNHMTNTRNNPVETLESEYPLRVLNMRIRADSEGAGQMRGGMGMRREFLILEDGVRITVGSDRHRVGPPGVHAGHSGSCASISVLRDKKVIASGSKMTFDVHSGDVVRIDTAGGGGWGDPGTRAPLATAGDVMDKLISAERAREIYKVVLSQDGSVDEQATASLRGPLVTS